MVKTCWNRGACLLGAFKYYQTVISKTVFGSISENNGVTDKNS
jgi:hypothetical protein